MAPKGAISFWTSGKRIEAWPVALAFQRKFPFERRHAMTDKDRKHDASKDEPERKDDKSSENKKHQDELLDEGVEETFPASDPVSVKITK
jgi:hypothetical protein